MVETDQRETLSFVHSAAPSKVIHLRNLPVGFTDTDLHTLCSPFGRIEKTLPMINKQQAFVQLDSVENAARCLGTLSKL